MTHLKLLPSDHSDFSPPVSPSAFFDSALERQVDEDAHHVAQIHARYNDVEAMGKEIEDETMLLVKWCFPKVFNQLGDRLVEFSDPVANVLVTIETGASRGVNDRVFPIKSEVLSAYDSEDSELFTLSDSGQFRLFDDMLRDRIKVRDTNGIYDIPKTGSVKLTNEMSLIDFYSGRDFLRFNPKMVAVPRSLRLAERAIKNFKLPDERVAFPDYNPSGKSHTLVRLSEARDRLELIQALIHLHIVDSAAGENENSIFSERYELRAYYPQIDSVIGLRGYQEQFTTAIWNSDAVFGEDNGYHLTEEDLEMARGVWAQKNWVEGALEKSQSITEYLLSAVPDLAMELTKESF
jgi:hypothetical protein